MLTLPKLIEKKLNHERIAAIALYDATLARIAEQANTDVLLVGDSLGMVIKGHTSTHDVSINDMLYHTNAVARGAPHTFIIADMPFGSLTSVERCVAEAVDVIKAGAHMVKLEGGAWLKPYVVQLTQLGIPVCGHVGLTPQSIHMLDGYQLQGKSEASQEILLHDAFTLDRAGISMIVFECIPSEIAWNLSRDLECATIGIGAGAQTDGQVLVGYDLLGTHPQPPRFVKDFLAETNSIQAAMSAYVAAVHAGEFPTDAHSYT